jgi:hypothetical protein
MTAAVKDNVQKNLHVKDMGWNLRATLRGADNKIAQLLGRAERDDVTVLPQVRRLLDDA